MYIHDIHHLLYDIYIYHILFFDIYIYLYRYLFKTVHLYIFLHFPSTFPSPLWDGPPGAGPTSSANSKVSLAGAVGNSKAPTSSVCVVERTRGFFGPDFPGWRKQGTSKKGATETLEKKHPTICGGFFSEAKELKTKNPANVLFVGTSKAFGGNWQLMFSESLKLCSWLDKSTLPVSLVSSIRKASLKLSRGRNKHQRIRHPNIDS